MPSLLVKLFKRLSYLLTWMKSSELVERFANRNRSRRVLLYLYQHSGCDFLPVEPVMNLCGSLPIL